MATDGRRIVYSRAFVESLTPAEIEGVLAHEVMHCALAHHCRRGNRDRRVWNEAADLAINPILLENNFSLPQGALVEPEYYGLSAEDIYARLMQKNGGGASGQAAPKAGGAGGQAPGEASPGDGSPGSDEPRPGGFGEVMDATDDQGSPASPAEISRQQHEWRIAAEQAVRMANSCGHEPLGVRRTLIATRESRQDWRAILRAFIAATHACDYRWTPPNRRFIGSGLYLPSVERAGVGVIVIGVDTSGSIGEEELAQFAGEISAIAEQTQPEAIHVVYCDAAVQATQSFVAGETIELEPKGGGGTDFRPVFEWVDANEIEPKCLIYLTDLCCDAYPAVPAYPVLWVTDSKRTARFGETIQVHAD
jgi:predicted metal-dependent peptidase